VAVYRKKYAVWRMELSEPMYVLLRGLVSGKSVLEAIRAAARVWRGAAAELETSIFAWFQEWAAEGIFSAVDLRGRGKAGAAGTRQGA
jgi:hypothetical protein